MSKYTAHIKNQMRSVKFQIMILLNWDELDYGNFQKKMGAQYLQAYIPNDPAGIDMLLDTQIFWNWWKNHWLQRDEGFLRDPELRATSQELIVSMYRCTHDPDELVKEIRPHGLMLRESYAQMIGKITDDKICRS